jgi:hypothetical protein
LLGWVGAQDIIDERDSKVKRFFNKNHFELKDDNSRFRDAVYKFHKKLSKSKKQIFWNYPSK